MADEPVHLGPAPAAMEIADFPGHDVVAWAGSDGTVTVCEPRCPHQWSHFAAEGAIAGDTLVCTAHMWRFDADGCGYKLAMNGRRDDKAPLRVYRSEVRDGEVWAWLES